MIGLEKNIVALESGVTKMMINISTINTAITAAIKAVGEGYTYEDLRLNTVNLIAAASYLVGCVEWMRGEADDETGSD